MCGLRHLSRHDREEQNRRAGSTRHSNYLSNFEKEEEEQRTELLVGCGGKAE